jgi:hypothetical protein
MCNVYIDCSLFFYKLRKGPQLIIISRVFLVLQSDISLKSATVSTFHAFFDSRLTTLILFTKSQVLRSLPGGYVLQTYRGREEHINSSSPFPVGQTEFQLFSGRHGNKRIAGFPPGTKQCALAGVLEEIICSFTA